LRTFSFIFLLLLLGYTLHAQDGPGGVLGDTENRFWFDANDLNQSNGSQVVTWQNKGGNPNNANQTTVSDRPTFLSSGAATMNGFPVIRFDGVDDYFEIPDNSDLNTGSAQTVRSFHAVIRTGSNVNTRQVIYEEGGGTRGLNIYIFNGKLYIGAYNLANDDGVGSAAPWGFFATDTPIAANTKYIISYIKDGNLTATGTVKLYLDGCLKGTITGVGPIWPHGANIGLGAKNGATVFETGSSGGNGIHFSGDIAEFIHYRQAQSAAQRILIENYLSAKYDIPLSCTDLYIQDNSANGDYDYDIAGIGQSTSGANNISAQNEGILLIGKPTNLNANEYLIWGHDNGSLSNSITTNLPSTVHDRMERIWRFSEVNDSGTAVDVGAVNMEFDLDNFCVFATQNLKLLIDTDNDGSFADETPVGTATSLGGTKYSFSSISNISNGNRLTVVNTKPEIYFSSNPICEGEKVKIYTDNGSAYRWSTGSTDQSFTATPSSTTIYTVTISNASGCTVTKTHTLVVNQYPNVSDVTLTCPFAGGPAATSHDYNVAATWSISSAPSGSNPTVNNTGLVQDITVPGNYILIADNNGCVIKVQITIPICCPVPDCIPVTIRQLND